MTTVKDLKEKLADLDDDMEVIVCGEYGYGKKIDSAKVERKGRIYDSGETEEEINKVLSLNIDSYLAESDDLGYIDLYVDEDDLEEYLNAENEEDCEFDCD